LAADPLGHTAVRHQQCLSDRLLVAKHHLCPRFADYDDVWVIHNVLLVEITPRDQRSTESVEPTGHEIIRWRAFALRDRRHIPFRFRVKRRARTASERETGTDHCVLEPGRVP